MAEEICLLVEQYLLSFSLCYTISFDSSICIYLTRAQVPNIKLNNLFYKKNLTFRNWQIPLLESWNMILCVSFLVGFSKSLVSFSHIFITGGSGKNGSTVAVSTNIDTIFHCILLFFFFIWFFPWIYSHEFFFLTYISGLKVVCYIYG